jgi:hypothetical protein
MITKDDLVDQNWTWRELQVMDMHHVDKNIPKLELTSNQWKEENGENDDLRFSINVTRSNEDMKNHIFLDNIERVTLLFCGFSHIFYKRTFIS